MKELKGLMQGMSKIFYVNGYSVYADYNPPNICLFKGHNRSTRKQSERCINLTIKVSEQCY